MYRKILVTLDHTSADEVLIPHISKLAALTGAELILVHVADGFAARNFNQLQLAESEEIRSDREYLTEIANRISAAQPTAVSTRLVMGDPPREILKLAQEEGCDLIAMTTHGHRLIGDIILGSTIEYVRHRSLVPLLTVSALEPPKSTGADVSVSSPN